MEQAAEERKKDEMGPNRHKLLRFLEDVEDLDVQTLLPRVEAAGLQEERVAFLYREQRHAEALRVLLEVLDDLERAEIYCHVVKRKASKSLAASAEDVSIFCKEPPLWAKPVAFPGGQPSSATTSAMAEDDNEAPGDNEDAAGAPRPFNMLLALLLRCFKAAVERPDEQRRSAAEYKEAALALLTTYATHRDLPPEEVLDLLPEDWDLAGLSSYLSRCMRACLHAQRAGILEENLSSMAYLKTFSAWSNERATKVVIENASCCAVCHTRILGKAFVAYPNSTCVHLQCAQSYTVCPKTGKDFSDNLSVFCHPL